MEAQRKGRGDAVVLAHYYTDGAVQAMADYGGGFLLSRQGRGAGRTRARSSSAACGSWGRGAKILNPRPPRAAARRSGGLPDGAHGGRRKHPRPARAGTRPRRRLLYQLHRRTQGGERTCASPPPTRSGSSPRCPTKTSSSFRTKTSAASCRRRCAGKRFYFSGGYCPVHAQLLASDVEREKLARPKRARARPSRVPGRAACAGGLYRQHVGDHFLCGKERGGGVHPLHRAGVLWELSRRCPGKRFVPTTPVCADMKRITPAKVEAARGRRGTRCAWTRRAWTRRARPLERMLELAR